MKNPVRVLMIAAVCQFGLLLCRAQGLDSVAPANTKTIPGVGANAASAETWTPDFEAGKKPDLQKILVDARKSAENGRYEEALQRYIWFHKHALEYDRDMRGVRLSFALWYWIELGKQYPKARQALVEIRDSDAQRFHDGHGNSHLFQDVRSINNYLGQDDATYALFKDVERQDQPLAEECFPFAEDVLVAHHEYTMSFDYIDDPQQEFEKILDSRAQIKRSEDVQDEIQERIRIHREAMEKTNPSFATLPALPGLPKSPKFADKHFIDQTRQLIEILVGANHRPEAEKIRDEALGILNDDRIKSAINDAEENIRKPAGISEAATPPPASPSFQPHQTENQGKNHESGNVSFDYVGDPQSEFERIRDSRTQLKTWEDRQAAQQDQLRTRQPPKFADKNFVNETRQLIEILVRANRRSVAEKIRDEALSIVNDDRIKSAISDAEENIRKPAGISQSTSQPPMSPSFQPNQTGNQDKNSGNKNAGYVFDPRTGEPIPAGQKPVDYVFDPRTGTLVRATNQPGAGH